MNAEKTICGDFDVQLEISEMMYGRNLNFKFSKENVRALLKNVTEYPEEIKRRVEDIIFTQMRKYRYLRIRST